MAFVGMKIRFKKLFPVLFSHPRQADGARFRKSSPETLNCLKTFAGINRNRWQTRVRFFIQENRSLFGNAIFAGLGGQIMTEESACYHMSLPQNPYCL